MLRLGTAIQQSATVSARVPSPVRVFLSKMENDLDEIGVSSLLIVAESSMQFPS